MFSAISAFVATTTGKVVLGSAVAAAAAGGAQSTDLIDLPGSTDGSDRETVVDVDDDSVTTTTVDDSATDRTDGVEEPTNVLDDGRQGAGHGQEVSDFAGNTELEGCEKGQAIAAIASSNAAAHRQNPERDRNPCEKNTGEPDSDSDTGTGDDGPNRPAGPPNGQGSGGAPPAPTPTGPSASPVPTQPGPPVHAGPPAHAGGPRN